VARPGRRARSIRAAIVAVAVAPVAPFAPFAAAVAVAAVAVAAVAAWLQAGCEGRWRGTARYQARRTLACTPGALSDKAPAGAYAGSRRRDSARSRFGPRLPRPAFTPAQRGSA